MDGINNSAMYWMGVTGSGSGVNAKYHCLAYDGWQGNWYLPAAGELYDYLGGNYSKLKITASNLGWENFDNKSSMIVDVPN